MSTRYYRDIFSVMDDIFNETFTVLQATQPVRINKLISSNTFPPTNIYVDKETKVMTIESALAGVREDQINLSFDGEQIKLIVKNEDCKGYNKDAVYLQTGLKQCINLETAWNIDTRFYDRDTIETTFENGLLTIVISPREEVKPKKMSLFGKLKIEDKVENKDQLGDPNFPTNEQVKE